ncbi:Protein of unknown function (DUF3469) [Moritella viscosa]|uniref:Uncharacterized protein n=1 Tax=Moritella viscosa TaxID=80854 RepID=A0ABY1HMW2_9GAMM|nr:Protein of unknown function (DUF3469) [Moritella viscosa]SGZ02564.1 Protein of unknown function (DUF3469) [Moritella viscosa]SHO25283.1 Protein of unknown function (DUF3469) [Moritella viscosa]
MVLIQYISISAIVSNMAQLDTWISNDQVYQNVTLLYCTYNLKTDHSV